MQGEIYPIRQRDRFSAEAPNRPITQALCNNMQITIIHLEDDMFISKESYDSWRQIQDEFESYKASLGPWDAEEVIEYLSDEYTNLNPSAEIQVKSLLQDAEQARKVTFNE